MGAATTTGVMEAEIILLGTGEMEGEVVEDGVGVTTTTVTIEEEVSVLSMHFHHRISCSDITQCMFFVMI